MVVGDAAARRHAERGAASVRPMPEPSHPAPDARAYLDSDLPYRVDPLTGDVTYIVPTRQGRPNLPVSSCPFCPGGLEAPDDYDVFDGNQHVGRIVLATQAPQGIPWSWMITARTDSAQNRGFAVSLEQAMRELTARWVNPSRF